MLKSCQYCGRIHDTKTLCAQKKREQERRWAERENTPAAGFRKKNAWTEKSREIRERDHYLCLCCKENAAGTVRRLNGKDLSVHHIVPIEEDYDMRLDDENLITVCGMHHEMCEAGEISREDQRRYVMKSMGMG